MKRKFIELEVDTERTNKDLKVKASWKIPGVKVIQVTINAVRKGGK